MKIFLISIFTCFALSLQAQNNVEVLNDSKEGHHVLNYSRGRKQIEFNIVNGMTNGQVIRYYKSGKVWDVREIVNNKYNGSVTVYDGKGRIRFYQTTRNDTLLSEVDSGYYFLSKHLYATWSWNKESDSNFDKLSPKNKDAFDNFWNYYGYAPVINGTTTFFYKSGQKKKEKPRTNGKRNGVCKWFDKNGTIIKSATYEMGKRVD